MFCHWTLTLSSTVDPRKECAPLCSDISLLLSRAKFRNPRKVPKPDLGLNAQWSKSTWHSKNCVLAQLFSCCVTPALIEYHHPSCQEDHCYRWKRLQASSIDISIEPWRKQFSITSLWRWRITWQHDMIVCRAYVCLLANKKHNLGSLLFTESMESEMKVMSEPPWLLHSSDRTRGVIQYNHLYMSVSV